MIALALLAALVAVVVGLVWAATIGQYAAVVALITFVAVLVLGAARDGRRLP